MTQAFKLPDDDRHALHELSTHVNHTIDVLKTFNKGHAKKEEISDAFKRILRDTNSRNQIERKLASYIINELKLLNLKIKHRDGSSYNAYNFLHDYWDGKIHDVNIIEMGFKGIAGPAMLAILKNCKTDFIMDQYG